ncbi:small COPII coat GTPase sar1 [Nemania serpens]|nr:small COPII coat GTPase sar1 [Nemania serpens]
MGVLSRLYSLMEHWYPFQRPGKILILGPSKAGKSTLLTRLAHNRFDGLRSVLDSTSEELVIQNVRFVATNLGSHQHIHDVDGIFLLVNAAGHRQFPQVKAELDALLAMRELRAVPIVVLGNKIDSQYAVSEEELRCVLGLEHIRGRPIELYMCALAFGQGYVEALGWLATNLQ